MGERGSYKFYIAFLIWLIFMWRLKDVVSLVRSSRLKVFLRKGVLKICGKCSYKRIPMLKCDFNKSHLLCSVIKIAPRHGCSLVNLLHSFRTPLPKSTSGWLLLSSCFSFMLLASSVLLSFLNNSILFY